MRFRCLVIVLAFLAAFASDSWGQSKQPTPPPTEPAQTNQASKPYERGTEHSPVIVKILPTKESEEKGAADARREDEKTENDRRLARFTELLFWATCALSIIALFQLLVFGWQGIQLMRAVSATKEATELGNKEFITTHRPRIRLRRIQPIMPFKTDERVEAVIEAANIGDTPATIFEIGVDIYIADRTFNAEPIPINALLVEPGRQARITVRGSQILDQSRIVNVQAGKMWLQMVGIINYRDDNGTIRTTSFARQYNTRLSRFVGVQDDNPEKDRDYEN